MTNSKKFFVTLVRILSVGLLMHAAHSLEEEGSVDVHNTAPALLQLRREAAVLQYNLRRDLGGLRQQINKKLEEDRCPEEDPEEELRDTILKDELIVRKIDLPSEVEAELGGFLQRILLLCEAKERSQKDVTAIAIAAAQIAPDEREGFLEAIRKLLEFERPINKVKGDIINTLFSQVSPERTQEFIEIISPLFHSEDDNGLDRERVVKTLGNMENGQCRQFVDIVFPVKSQKMSSMPWANMIEVFHKVPLEQLQEFVGTIKPLLDLEGKEWKFSYMMRIVADIEPGERDSFVQDFLEFLPWLSSDIDGRDHVAVMEALHKVGSEELHELIELCNIIEQTSTSKSYFRMTEMVQTMKELRMVKPAERRELVESIKPLLTPYMDTYARAHVVSTLRNLPSGRRQNYAESIKPLLVPAMDGEIRAEFIEVLWHIESEERKEFVQMIQSLLPPGVTMDVGGRFEKGGHSLDMFEWQRAIQILGEMDTSQRKEYVDSIRPLLSSEIEIPGRVSFIRVLRDFTPEERSAFIENVKSLLPAGAYKYSWCHVISILCKMNLTEQDEFINRVNVKRLITRDMTAERDVKNVLQPIASINPEQRREFVEILHPIVEQIPDKDDRVGVMTQLASDPSEKIHDVCTEFMHFLSLLRENESNQNNPYNSLVQGIKEIKNAEGLSGLVRLAKLTAGVDEVFKRM